MKALITGANGHIGSHVVRACLESGITPIAFVRTGSDRRALAGLEVEILHGDLRDATSVARAAKGVEVIFHLGAVHRNWDPDESKIVWPAVIGTRNVLEAARDASVRRVVCTSSAVTIGFTADVAVPLNESAARPTLRQVYGRAKLEAEELALSMAGDVEVVVLNPSGVFGPLDFRLTPATRALIGLLQGDPAFLGVALTDVRDVASAHVLAAWKGVSQQRYLVTGEAFSPAQLAQAFKEVTGIEPTVFRPPRFLLRLLAGSAERKARKTGQDAALTRDQVDDAFGMHLSYDSRRAKSELGANFRPPKTVLRDAVRWLLFVGALKPKVAARIRSVLGAEASAPDTSWRQ